MIHTSGAYKGLCAAASVSSPGVMVLVSSLNEFDASPARDELLVLPSELETEPFGRRGLDRYLRLGTGCGAT